MDTLGSYLTQDHERCDALFGLACSAVRETNWSDAAAALTNFRHVLERHLLIEERIVFPAFERALGHAIAPTAAMRAEHLRIRGVVQRIADALAERDRSGFMKHADTLGIVLYEHAEKEEGALYPMIERVLAHSSGDLLAAMRAFGAYDRCANAA